MTAAPENQALRCVGAAVTLALLPLSLMGCSGFGTTGNKDCDGSACDCAVNYYGIEAKMLIYNVPVEHASIRVTIPSAEPDVQNSTGCCQALFPLRLVHEAGKNTSTDAEFCNACASSPNHQLKAAASSCRSPSTMLAQAFSRVSARKSKASKASNVDAWKLKSAEDESDSYNDCDFDIDGQTVHFQEGFGLDLGKTNFNIKWTDKKDSQEQSCCEALQPVVKALYFSAEPPKASVWAPFCSACKSAYNPGVGLAAFRACSNASLQESPAVRTKHVAALDTTSTQEGLLGTVV